MWMERDKDSTETKKYQWLGCVGSKHVCLFWKADRDVHGVLDCF